MTFMNMSVTHKHTEATHKYKYSTPLRVSLTWIIVTAVTQKTTYPPALELAYSLFNWGAAG